VKRLVGKVIGAAIAGHREISPGFPEQVYEKALLLELGAQNIEHACQFPAPVFYRGSCVGQGRVDPLVEEKVVVELKVVDSLADVHRAHVPAYLKALNLRLGLLVNFNAPYLRDGLKRVLNEHSPRLWISAPPRPRVRHE